MNLKLGFLVAVLFVVIVFFAKKAKAMPAAKKLVQPLFKQNTEPLNYNPFDVTSSTNITAAKNMSTDVYVNRQGGYKVGNHVVLTSSDSNNPGLVIYGEITAIVKTADNETYFTINHYDVAGIEGSGAGSWNISLSGKAGVHGSLYFTNNSRPVTIVARQATATLVYDDINIAYVPGDIVKVQSSTAPYAQYMIIKIETIVFASTSKTYTGRCLDSSGAGAVISNYFSSLSAYGCLPELITEVTTATGLLSIDETCDSVGIFTLAGAKSYAVPPVFPTGKKLRIINAAASGDISLTGFVVAGYTNPTFLVKPSSSAAAANVANGLEFHRTLTFMKLSNSWVIY